MWQFGVGVWATLARRRFVYTWWLGLQVESRRVACHGCVCVCVWPGMGVCGLTRVCLLQQPGGDEDQNLVPALSGKTT